MVEGWVSISPSEKRTLCFLESPCHPPWGRNPPSCFGNPMPLRQGFYHTTAGEFLPTHPCSHYFGSLALRSNPCPCCPMLGTMTWGRCEGELGKVPPT